MFSRDGSQILTSMPQELPPIDFLRAFARAAETLSFKDAAAQLHLSPSAVSSSPGFSRRNSETPRCASNDWIWRLTAEGRQYLESVHRVLRELRQAQEALA